MIKDIKRYHLFLAVIITLCLILSGCARPTSGTGPGRMLTLEPGYKYRIMKIDTADAPEYEVDVKEMLRGALEKALQEKNLLWHDSSDQKYYGISSSIIEYEMGNAFKRWLLPTYGSTILGVHTDIIDAETNEVLTYMEHRQTIAAGGLYSVRAWKYVFDSVAKDIAIDIERKFSGKGEGFFVQLNPWLEKESEAPESSGTMVINLSSFQDLRPERNRIGERTALKVPMGDIYATRDALSYIREAVQNELLAAGNSLAGEEKTDIILSGDLVKFWVQTPSTPLYWDIIGEIELKLSAKSKNDGRIVEKTYQAKGEARTYVWPTEKLVTTVVSDTVRTLMYEIRRDRIWTTL